MKRYTFYDEVEKRHYVEEFPLELQVREVGKEYHNFSPANDKLGELEDFMEDNGFETIEDLKNNYESKRIARVRENCEVLINAYEIQHKNDIKELERMKKACVKDEERLVQEIIDEVKRFYKTKIDKNTYVKLASVLNFLKDKKQDVSTRW